jgi:ATP-dependent DNA helicase UvrD/PcrA
VIDIILGPPGTGKTTSLINRVEDALARGVPPDRIGYFSFTRKAAREAIDRACEKFSLDRKDFPHFSTLHSMCYRQLGIKRGEVLEGEKMQEFAKYAGVKISGKWSEDGTLSGFDFGDRVVFKENLARIRQIPLRQAYDEDDDNMPWREVERVSAALRKFKKAHGLMDFTDMLNEFIKSGMRLGIDELMIDESQDLSKMQWSVVNQLMGNSVRTAVAGDDDQAIYRWAGADVDHLIDLTGDVRVLGQSYRVPPVIQAVALKIIRGVRRRREKQWAARAGADGVVERKHRIQNVDVSAGQTLVLARNSYVIRNHVVPELRKKGIVFEWHGHSSINMNFLHAIQGWERLRRGETVTVAEARKIYGLMTSGLGFTRGNKKLPDRGDEDTISIQELRDNAGLLTNEPWHEALDRLPKNEISYIRTARQRGEKLGKTPRVSLSTIHSAKGGQADHVVVLKEIATRTWLEMKRSAAAEEDERRCWYVAATRAKERLTIVESTTPRACPWL